LILAYAAGGRCGEREFITLLGSAAVTQPFAARAGQAVMPTIGYLSGGLPDDAPEYLNYFRQGLAATGFTEGRNVAIEYRFAAGRLEEVAKLADDLVLRHVMSLRYQTQLNRQSRPRQRRKPFR